MRVSTPISKLLMVRLVSLLALLALFAPMARSSSIDLTVEYRIKAAYLYNFTKFIEWPPAAFAGPDSPFILGIVDPEGTAYSVISESLRGKTTSSGRPIVVKRIDAQDIEASSCSQIFITRASGLDPSTVRTGVGDRPIVVVGETDGFAERGGIIGFIRTGDAVHCEVNLAGAQRAGVKLSGRLASVARLVRETSRR